MRNSHVRPARKGPGWPQLADCDRIIGEARPKADNIGRNRGRLPRSNCCTRAGYPRLGLSQPWRCAPTGASVRRAAASKPATWNPDWYQGHLRYFRYADGLWLDDLQGLSADYGYRTGWHDASCWHGNPRKMQDDGIRKPCTGRRAEPPRLHQKPRRILERFRGRRCRLYDSAGPRVADRWINDLTCRVLWRRGIQSKPDRTGSRWRSPSSADSRYHGPVR